MVSGRRGGTILGRREKRQRPKNGRASQEGEGGRREGEVVVEGEEGEDKGEWWRAGQKPRASEQLDL